MAPGAGTKITLVRKAAPRDIDETTILQRDDVIRIGFWTLISSPMWLPVVGVWLPLITARKIRRWLGIVTIATFIFAMANASDRDPAQWPAMFVFRASVFAYFAGVLWTWIVQLRIGLLTRRLRMRATTAA